MSFRAFLFLPVSAALMLSACAKNNTIESTVHLEAADLGADYKANSCSAKFEDGENVSPMSSKNIVSPFFGKPFDENRLRAVGKASAKSIASFLPQDGVEPYAIPLSVGGCTILAPLGQPSQALLNDWNQINHSRDLKMVGLFLPYERVSADGANTPVILIREDADRYDLIHEYMHYLFNREREASGTNSIEISSLYARRHQAAAKFLPLVESAMPTAIFSSEVARVWLPYAKSTIQVVIAYPFEEVAVEAVLTQASIDGILTSATAYDRKLSMSYITENFIQGDQQLMELYQDAKVLQHVLQRDGLNQQLEQVNEIIDSTAKLMMEGQRINNTYGTPARMRKLMEQAQNGSGHGHGGGNGNGNRNGN